MVNIEDEKDPKKPQEDVIQLQILQATKDKQIEEDKQIEKAIHD